MDRVMKQSAQAAPRDPSCVPSLQARFFSTQALSFAGGVLGVITAVAVVAMLVACFGVANVMIAGVEARRFEFGVLRAVGAQRGVLTRLVLGEAVVIALADFRDVRAHVTGTLDHRPDAFEHRAADRLRPSGWVRGSWRLHGAEDGI